MSSSPPSVLPESANSNHHNILMIQTDAQNISSRCYYHFNNLFMTAQGILRCLFIKIIYPIQGIMRLFEIKILAQHNSKEESVSYSVMELLDWVDSLPDVSVLVYVF